MPYDIRRSGCSSSKPYGVFKRADGKRMGCHESRAKAARQIAALEASEAKEMSEDLPAEGTEEQVEKAYVPSSVISFDELEEMQRAAKMAQHTQDTVDSFTQLVHNIVMNDGIDREAALNRLVGELQQRMEGAGKIQFNMDKEEDVTKAAIKREGGIDFPSRDFAYVPDPTKPSTWKLRLTISPGKVTKEQLGRAAAALSPGGFRGNRAQIPPAAMSSVKRRIRAEYRKLGVSPQEIPNSVKEINDSDFLVWKSNDGTWKWMTVYSNNYRDNDAVPEIISEKSHKTFEYLVDNGVVDMPELWLWHVPGTAWGQADMVTYSDGFSIAAGHVYEGKEHIADSLTKAAGNGEDIAVSHGMPAQWIRRNPSDPTIIDFHITKEISPLPRNAAANKLTGFVVFKESGDVNMGIPDAKKSWLLEVAGLDQEFVAELESGLAASKQAADEAGVESKEAEAETEVEVEEAIIEEVTEEAVDEAPEEEAKEAESVEEDELAAEEEPQVDPVQREEVEEALKEIGTLLKDSVEAILQRVESLESKIAILQEDDAAKIAEMKELTPTDSLADIVRASVIGKADAVVDGRTSLAKDGPEETEAAQRSITGVPFLDSFMNGTADAE